jgi:hypothetical protein
MPKKYDHILLKEFYQNSDYTSTSKGGPKLNIPSQNRQSHSQFLKLKLKEAWQQTESEQAVCHADRHGVYLEIKGEQGYDLVTKSLENRRSKDNSAWTKLLNVRNVKEEIQNPNTGQVEEVLTTYATVFVPHIAKKNFISQLHQYATENTEKGNPKHKNLMNSIATFQKALLVDSFWQDTIDLIPKDQPKWCEVWLSNDSDVVINSFENLLTKLNIRSKKGFIRFPERVVKVIFANNEQLEKLTLYSDDIAEYRIAKETSQFWMEMENQEQVDWIDNLLDRLEVDQNSNTSVCILDTGINFGHPLIAPLLSEHDSQSVDKEWGIYDHDKHGTLMAGVAAYGDLMKQLSGNQKIQLSHLLESVKILPAPPKQTEPELWGYITAQGVFLAEIKAPGRNRTICMAITSKDVLDKGRPSSWSGAIDQLISGAEDNTQRLFIVCAGNIDPDQAGFYPDVQLSHSIHDPGQSWNTLTVGAYTNFTDINDPTLSGYNAIAPEGGLSPFSTTSLTWDDKWPIKPEIVMEGGNLAIDQQGATTECDDLCLLSTNYNTQTKYFYPHYMTSASAAQAAWFSAQIQVRYTDYWPETIRALMVHSAEWTNRMKQQFLLNDSKTEYKKLLRIFGYGVPNLEKALNSVANSLTLISQETLQPFDKKKDKPGYKTKDMHLYDLPWPKDDLLNLPLRTKVEMRITLSYFIEPGPGEVGWKDRYRYASHGLRFDVKSPSEEKDEFIKRINADARAEDEGHPGTQSASNHWVIGQQTRNKGSIHSDIWKGTAAELSDSNIIAIYPVIGWWRERKHLNKWDRKTRYSLVVSISTPEETIDIYTPIVNQIKTVIEISI